MAVDITVVTYEQLIGCVGSRIDDHYKEAPWWGLDLHMDHVLYLAAETSDSARFYLARVDGEIAGYISLLAAPMMQHKGTMQAVTESFYVAPEYREHGVFAKLLKYIEKDCKACGIQFLTLAFPSTERGVLDRFVKIAGYKDSEVSYTKEL